MMFKYDHTFNIPFKSLIKFKSNIYKTVYQLAFEKNYQEIIQLLKLKSEGAISNHNY